jgi:hypothetical protein
MVILVTTDPMYQFIQTTSRTMLTGVLAGEIVGLNREHGPAIRLVDSEGES